MSGTARSSEGLDPRRKRLLFRCWHRGTREMDLFMGSFANEQIEQLSDAELDQLEALLELPDLDVYADLTGANPLPSHYAGSVLDRLKTFRVPDL
jgi:antitoxin CptB